ncbi:hypothetical protein [Heliorestis convoluta]|uniref:Uncharacterized protein n=1 Tax=Heliorestis convoluta TaxID=356322 RepID=A0A5Q2N0N4_9FIRM|nr:hypothetical protein [Heliorestis convoluta]QGG48884.1 hypothetical protein FTV88_2795 [Heliorestis convoluta]
MSQPLQIALDTQSAEFYRDLYKKKGPKPVRQKLYKHLGVYLNPREIRILLGLDENPLLPAKEARQVAKTSVGLKLPNWYINPIT